MKYIRSLQEVQRRSNLLYLNRLRIASPTSSVRNGNSGFTLLELLVSIIIFSLISAAGYSILKRTTESKLSVDKRSEDIRELQNTIITIQDDLGQVVLRKIRDETGNKQPAINSGKNYLIEFTRTGWPNPVEHKRSELQRVAYSFHDDKLIRYYWPVLDRAENSQPSKRILLSNINSASVSFLDSYGNWHEQWSATNIAPDMVKINFRHKHLGTIEKTVKISAFIPQLERGVE